MADVVTIIGTQDIVFGGVDRRFFLLVFCSTFFIGAVLVSFVRIVFLFG